MIRHFVPVLVIFVASCAQDKPSQNNICTPNVCQKIYGRESDWDTISDDLVLNIYRHNLMCENTGRGDY